MMLNQLGEYKDGGHLFLATIKKMGRPFFLAAVNFQRGMDTTTRVLSQAPTNRHRQSCSPPPYLKTPYHYKTAESLTKRSPLHQTALPFVNGHDLSLLPSMDPFRTGKRSGSSTIEPRRSLNGGGGSQRRTPPSHAANSDGSRKEGQLP